jgi:adenylyltransferase/sulfurtransferase
MRKEFERYTCQMHLPGFGESSQTRLQNARVLIVGMGGLGCPAAQYLVSSGIGHLTLVDDDTIAESNLHRQILYSQKDLGLSKATVAAEVLKQQNPAVVIEASRQRVTSANVMELITGFDLVIDATDNFETRYVLNDACVLLGIPLVYGAIYRFEGQVAVWNVRTEDHSYTCNYRDVFPDADKAAIPDCSEGGVIPTLAGIVGCMQANEAIKYLVGHKDLLAGKLWIMNVLDGQSRVISLKKQTHAMIKALQETVPVVTLDDMQELAPFGLLDVRTGGEHKAASMGGINIPVDELPERLHELPLSDPLLVYCATGRRSAAAVVLIRERYPGARVYSLKGGTDSNDNFLNYMT